VKIVVNFDYTGDPYQKNNSKFFSHPNMKIYAPIESPCRVDSSLIKGTLETQTNAIMAAFVCV
jgi:hypothetical protein